MIQVVALPWLHIMFCTSLASLNIILGRLRSAAVYKDLATGAHGMTGSSLTSSIILKPTLRASSSSSSILYLFCEHLVPYHILCLLLFYEFILFCTHELSCSVKDYLPTYPFTTNHITSSVYLFQ